MVSGSLVENSRKRADAIRERAQRLGVLDITFSGGDSSRSLECYERTLDFIEQNKETLDRNAGEAGD